MVNIMWETLSSSLAPPWDVVLATDADAPEHCNSRAPGLFFQLALPLRHLHQFFQDLACDDHLADPGDGSSQWSWW